MWPVFRRTAAAAAVVALAVGPPLRAQRVAGARPGVEARIDYLGRSPDVIHAGVGLNIPAGTYLRVSVVGAAGASWEGSRSGGSARADVIGRFLFDPFRERRWGLSAGGGLSVRYDQVRVARPWRPLLALVVDLEGPQKGTMAAAVQVGLGGGARVGLVLRRADPNRR